MHSRLFNSIVKIIKTPFLHHHHHHDPIILLNVAATFIPKSSAIFNRKFHFTQSNSAPASNAALTTIPVVSTITSPFEIPPPPSSKPMSLWPGTYHSPVTNALWEATFTTATASVVQSASSLITTKTPSQSRTTILFKFTSDFTLREQYRNPCNEIRMPNLLQDLDILAATISLKHCSNNNTISLVTASLDKMLLKKPIRVDTDLRIVGAVTWVGRSSMEIRLELTQSPQQKSNPSDEMALEANFTFVARDSKTGESAVVHKLSPETERERLLWEEAQERSLMKKKKRGEGKKEMEDRGANKFKELLAQGRIFCDLPALANRDNILLKDTCLQNSFICQPQQRNVYGKIFGGFLMRRAFELAYATTYAFLGSAPCFVEVDNVEFLRPVDVGDFLRLNSCVLYTELENQAQPFIHVEVVAHVTKPEFKSSEVSNKFYFKFTVRAEALKEGIKIRNVVPATEEEAWRIIERMDVGSSNLLG